MSSEVHFLKHEETAYLRLKDQLLARFPELAEDEQALVDTLDGETSLHEQICAVMRARADRLAMAEALKARMADMKARHDRLLHGAEQLREVCSDVMQRAGIKKVQADDMTLSLQAGRARVVITDPEAIPDELTRTKVTVEPDKTKIADALAEGLAVPGAVLSNGGAVLTVRVK